MTVKVEYNFPAAMAAVDEGTRKQLLKIATYMKVHCMTSHTVGWGRRTGDLMRSYRVEANDTGWMLVTDTVYYAGFVEFGTRRMVAQKHMRNAAEATASKFGGSLS